MNRNVNKSPLTYLSWLFLVLILTCCCPHQYVPNPCPEPLPPFLVPKKIQVALVLGCGGVRGMAHVGVLEELEAAGITVDLIVGCSAGSYVGALYADNPSVEGIWPAVWGLRTQTLLDIDLLNSRYGLSQGYSMRRALNKYLHTKTFDDLKIPLVIVASDLCSGELVPLGSGDLVKAILSSCAIPFVYVPREHMGRILVDGGVINPVPVKVARDLGAEVVIAVDLCELLPTTFPTNLFGVVKRSAEIAFMWQNVGCTRNADVVIRPKTCGVGTFNDRMRWQIYQAGKQAAREQMDNIKAALVTISSEPKETGWRTVQLNPYPPQIWYDGE